MTSIPFNEVIGTIIPQGSIIVVLYKSGASTAKALEDARMPLQHTIKAVIRSGEISGYVAECVEIPVVTQGDTLDETASNLREATALFLENEMPAHHGLTNNPTIIITLELDPAHA